MPSGRARMLAAFAAVYLVWGSTYLAIRFAIETLPPFTMAGVRFLVSGAALYGWSRWRGSGRPTAAHWRAAAIVGLLLLLGGNGAVVWAEQHVASGLVALLIATEPFWIVMLDWARPGGQRPTGLVVAGLLVGFAGVLFLVGPASLVGGGAVDPVGVVVVLFGAAAWAAGSLYTVRGARLPGSPLLATGMQMMAGGAALLLLGGGSGEWAGLRGAEFSVRSLLSLLYLVVFGSLVGFTAYVYLLRNTTPARASTYAFVNPEIAVLLGWLFAGESVTTRVVIGALAIVSAVALITQRGSPVSGSPPAEKTAGPSARAGGPAPPGPGPGRR
jgi:drug/metabolite transporter (DMT)-like permease